MRKRDYILLAISVLALLLAVIDYGRGQTQIGPQQMKAPRVTVMTCTQIPSCAGLYLVDVITPAGTELKIVGSASANPGPVSDWSLVP